jgi:AcrR family transcriptional regulator
VDELSEQARAWLDPAVDFALDRGLAELTLRPLAAELGTSDRMVIYHFGSKERLIARIVERASERLGESLIAQLTPPPASVFEAVMRFWEALTAEETAPYVHLYFELWTLSVRDPDQYGPAVQRITSAWLALIDMMFQATGDRVQPGAAADTLATLDGLFLLRQSLSTSVDTDVAAARFAARLTRSGA